MWTRPETGQVICGRFLLIPDTGGLSIPTFRVQLGRLVDLQRATGERLPVLVVATTSVARVRAWTTLVEQVTRARRSPPVLANITTWAGVGNDTQSRGWKTLLDRRLLRRAAGFASARNNRKSNVRGTRGVMKHGLGGGLHI